MRKNLISYLLPITIVAIIPSAIMFFTKEDVVFKQASIIIGAIFFALGLSLLVCTVRMFETAGKGTLAPWLPPRKLIVAGPYKYVRNPMISGVFFMLIGIWLVFLNFWILVWAVSVVIVNTIYFKLSEEPGLVKRFGEEYLKYRREVPMWIPIKFNRKK